MDRRPMFNFGSIGLELAIHRNRLGIDVICNKVFRFT